MSVPIENLTPRQIVAELDKYIVGQEAAKRAVAVALRNRYRRQQLTPAEQEDVIPKNILMMGPTGVGKTEIARRLAQLARAPFIKVEATKFTEVGYVGRDVESMVRDLAAASVRLVEREMTEAVRPEAERRATDRLIELLERSEPRVTRTVTRTYDEDSSGSTQVFGFPIPTSYEYEEEEPGATEARIQRIEAELAAGELEDREVEIETEEPNNPFVQVFTPQGMEEMGLDMNQAFPPKRGYRHATVKEAREVLIQEEARRLVNSSVVNREAVRRAEQTGIIFIDELDKVAGKPGGSGPDVSREGVQRDLLPIIEGSTVATKFGPVRTDYVLFIAAGAFHLAKPSDLIPELQGRLPIRVELEPLAEGDFRRILSEPKNALTGQYTKLLATEGITVTFTDDALDEVARLAVEVNQKTQNIGARRLHTVMEKLLEEVLFEAPETATKTVVFDGEQVRRRLSPLVGDIESSRSVL